MSHVASLMQLAGQSSDRQIAAVRKGFPAGTFSGMAGHLGVSQEQLAGALGIQPRTLRNRSQKQGKLTRDQSEKALRVARVFTKSRTLLGSEEKAKEWMTSPVKSLGGKKPLDLLETDIGGQDVLNALSAIEWGVYL